MQITVVDIVHSHLHRNCALSDYDRNIPGWTFAYWKLEFQWKLAFLFIYDWIWVQKSHKNKLN